MVWGISGRFWGMQWFWGPAAMDECPRPWVGVTPAARAWSVAGALDTCLGMARDAGARLGARAGLGNSSVCACLCLAQAGDTPHL